MTTLRESFGIVAKEKAGQLLIGISAFLLLSTIGLSLGSTSRKDSSTAPKPNETSTPAEETTTSENETENTLSLSTAWNSEKNKAALEYQIKHFTANSTTGAPQSIASVSCDATKTQPIWKCKIRKLGDTESYNARVEVDYENDNWASSSWQ